MRDRHHQDTPKRGPPSSSMVVSVALVLETLLLSSLPLGAVDGYHVSVPPLPIKQHVSTTGTVYQVKSSSNITRLFSDEASMNDNVAFLGQQHHHHQQQQGPVLINAYGTSEIINKDYKNGKEGTKTINTVIEDNKNRWSSSLSFVKVRTMATFVTTRLLEFVLDENHIRQPSLQEMNRLHKAFHTPIFGRLNTEGTIEPDQEMDSFLESLQEEDKEELRIETTPFIGEHDSAMLDKGGWAAINQRAKERVVQDLEKGLLNEEDKSRSHQEIEWLLQSLDEAHTQLEAFQKGHEEEQNDIKKVSSSSILSKSIDQVNAKGTEEGKEDEFQIKSSSFSSSPYEAYEAIDQRVQEETNKKTSSLMISTPKINNYNHQQLKAQVEENDTQMSISTSSDEETIVDQSTQKRVITKDLIHQEINGKTKTMHPTSTTTMTNSKSSTSDVVKKEVKTQSKDIKKPSSASASIDQRAKDRLKEMTTESQDIQKASSDSTSIDQRAKDRLLTTQPASGHGDMNNKETTGPSDTTEESEWLLKSLEESEATPPAHEDEDLKTVKTLEMTSVEDDKYTNEAVSSSLNNDATALNDKTEKKDLESSPSLSNQDIASLKDEKKTVATSTNMVDIAAPQEPPLTDTSSTIKPIQTETSNLEKSSKTQTAEENLPTRQEDSFKDSNVVATRKELKTTAKDLDIKDRKEEERAPVTNSATGVFQPPSKEPRAIEKDAFETSVALPKSRLEESGTQINEGSVAGKGKRISGSDAIAQKEVVENDSSSTSQQEVTKMEAVEETFKDIDILQTFQNYRGEEQVMDATILEKTTNDAVDPVTLLETIGDKVQSTEDFTQEKQNGEEIIEKQEPDSSLSSSSEELVSMSSTVHQDAKEDPEQKAGHLNNPLASNAGGETNLSTSGYGVATIPDAVSKQFGAQLRVVMSNVPPLRDTSNVEEKISTNIDMKALDSSTMMTNLKDAEMTPTASEAKAAKVENVIIPVQDQVDVEEKSLDSTAVLKQEKATTKAPIEGELQTAGSPRPYFLDYAMSLMGKKKPQKEKANENHMTKTARAKAPYFLNTKSPALEGADTSHGSVSESRSEASLLNPLAEGMDVGTLETESEEITEPLTRPGNFIGASSYMSSLSNPSASHEETVVATPGVTYLEGLSTSESQEVTATSIEQLADGEVLATFGSSYLESLSRSPESESIDTSSSNKDSEHRFIEGTASGHFAPPTSQSEENVLFSTSSGRSGDSDSVTSDEAEQTEGHIVRNPDSAFISGLSSAMKKSMSFFPTPTMLIPSPLQVLDNAMTISIDKQVIPDIIERASQIPENPILEDIEAAFLGGLTTTLRNGSLLVAHHLEAMDKTDDRKRLDDRKLLPPSSSSNQTLAIVPRSTASNYLDSLSSSARKIKDTVVAATDSDNQQSLASPVTHDMDTAGVSPGADYLTSLTRPITHEMDTSTAHAGSDYLASLTRPAAHATVHAGSDYLTSLARPATHEKDTSTVHAGSDYLTSLSDTFRNVDPAAVDQSTENEPRPFFIDSMQRTDTVVPATDLSESTISDYLTYSSDTVRSIDTATMEYIFEDEPRPYFLDSKPELTEGSTDSEDDATERVAESFFAVPEEVTHESTSTKSVSTKQASKEHVIRNPESALMTGVSKAMKNSAGLFSFPLQTMDHTMPIPTENLVIPNIMESETIKKTGKVVLDGVGTTGKVVLEGAESAFLGGLSFTLREGSMLIAHQLGTMDKSDHHKTSSKAKRKVAETSYLESLSRDVTKRNHGTAVRAESDYLASLSRPAKDDSISPSRNSNKFDQSTGEGHVESKKPTASYLDILSRPTQKSGHVTSLSRTVKKEKILSRTIATAVKASGRAVIESSKSTASYLAKVPNLFAKCAEITRGCTEAVNLKHMSTFSFRKPKRTKINSNSRYLETLTRRGKKKVNKVAVGSKPGYLETLKSNVVEEGPEKAVSKSSYLETLSTLVMEDIVTTAVESELGELENFSNLAIEEVVTGADGSEAGESESLPSRVMEEAVASEAVAGTDNSETFPSSGMKEPVTTTVVSNPDKVDPNPDVGSEPGNLEKISNPLTEGMGEPILDAPPVYAASLSSPLPVMKWIEGSNGESDITFAATDDSESEHMGVDEIDESTIGVPSVYLASLSSPLPVMKWIESSNGEKSDVTSLNNSKRGKYLQKISGLSSSTPGKSRLNKERNGFGKNVVGKQNV